MSDPVSFGVLGPIEVSAAGKTVPLTQPKLRRLLAIALANANHDISTVRLVRLLWADEPPPGRAAKTIQIYVSRLRTLFAADAPLLTTASGYRLVVDHGRSDADRFVGLVDNAQQEPNPAEALELLDEALGLWRGPAYGEFAQEPFALAEAVRLEEARLSAREDRIEAGLAATGSERFVEELTALVADHPLRERLRAQLMLALYRGGRQVDALLSYDAYRKQLADTLGLDPAPRLRELEGRILRQDPLLLARPKPSARPTRLDWNTVHASMDRRVVTALYAGLEDPAAAGFDVEAFGAELSAWLDAATGALSRHGATVRPSAERAVVGIFGTPQLHEDDALRACLAALEIRAARPPRLSVRQGLSTSEIVADSSSRQQVISGNVVETAVLLQRQAEPDAIVLDQGTRRLLGNSFRGKPLLPRSELDAAGQEPVWLLTDVTEPPPADIELVGRTRELAQLRRAFARAATARTAALCTVLGGAGIGKSRLARELAAHLGDRASVLTGRCLSYGDSITFWPLRGVIRQAAGSDTSEALRRLLRGSPDAEAIAGRVGAVLGHGTASGSLTETFWAVRKVLEWLARPRPVVVVFDDLHWAESTFLDLLEYLAGGIRDAGVLLLCLARHELLERRPGWAEDVPGAHVIELGPLTPAQVTAFVDRLSVGVEPSAEVREAVRSTAEGNPLFIEQCLAGLAETADPPASLEIPDHIRALLAARLDRLGPAERAVLERASVVGRDFHRLDVETLLPVAAHRSLPAELQSLVHKSLLRMDDAKGPDEFAFRHGLIRDVTYQSVTKGQRAELHERFADHLERQPDEQTEGYEEVLGYHLEQAHRCRAEIGRLDQHTSELASRAAAKLTTAGTRAHGYGDITSANELLRRALALQSDPPARGVILTELIGALLNAGDLTGADTAASQAIAAAQLTGDVRMEWRARVARVEVSARMTVQEAEAHRAVLQEAIPILERFDDREGLLQAHFLHALWDADWTPGFERALRYGDGGWREQELLGALALSLFFGLTPASAGSRRCAGLRARKRANRDVKACADIALGGLLGIQGELVAGRKLIARGRAIFQDLGIVLAVPYANLGGAVELAHQNPAAAEKALREGYDVLASRNETFHRTDLAALLAHSLCEQGRLDEALHFTDICESITPDDEEETQALWKSARARIRARQDKRTAAEELVRQAEQHARHDIGHGRARTLGYLADALLVIGQPLAAVRHLHEAVELYEQKEHRVGARNARRLLEAVRAGGR